MSEAKIKGGGASSAQGPSFSERYNAWLTHHRLSATDSLHRILDHPFSTIATWLVIGIALALPVVMWVLLENGRDLSNRWESPVSLSVFMKTEVNASRAKKLGATLRKRTDIAEVAFLSKEHALAEFAELSGFGDVLATLDDNPLPHILVVSPSVPDGGAQTKTVATLADDLRELPAVDQVVVDMQWVQRLDHYMEIAQRAVLVGACLLGLGVLLVLGNTIRLAIENRRSEIVIVKLVGGSNAFVRRPFLYTGLWYGMGGALIAWLLVSVCLWIMAKPVSDLVSLYSADFRLHGLSFIQGLQVLLAGGLLGLLGAGLAVSRHIGEIEPR